jgi:hypothetical protein
MWEEINGTSAGVEADDMYRSWLRRRMSARALQAWVVEVEGEAVGSDVLALIGHRARPHDPRGITPTWGPC